MIWSDVRETYPDQWFIIEALAARTHGNQRMLDRIAVVETCPDGTTAMQSDKHMHREYPCASSTLFTPPALVRDQPV